MNKTEILARIAARTPRSAWDRGVKSYAIDLLNEYEGENLPESGRDMEAALLCGAASWAEYSYGGCALCYDGDIAERLCTPSEFRRTRGGELNPNGRENWLDVQAGP